MYTSILVVALLFLNAEGILQPNIPFKQYGINCVKDGRDVTYRLQSLKEGDEVLCKVDYRSEPHQNPDILVETTEAENFPGTLGSDWEEIRKDARYLKHWALTLADSKATYTEEGVKVPYTGSDAGERSKFTQWENIVEEIIE